MHRLIVIMFMACTVLSAFAFDLYTNVGISQAVSKWYRITFGTNMNNDEMQYIVDMINYSAKKYNVDTEVITGIMAVESSFDTDAINDNSIGLMQVKHTTAELVTRKYGILKGNLHSVWYNIMCGVAYIAYLQNRYTYAETIMHYHGGSKVAMIRYYNQVQSAIKEMKLWK